MKYFQFSDGHFSCRLKALVLTKFNLQQKAINQTTACVHTAHTLRAGFEVPCNSQVGCVAQPRTRSVVFYYGIHSPKFITAVSFVPPQSNGSRPSRT